MAEEVTIDLTAQGFSNSQAVSTVTQDGVTLTFDKSSGQTTPAYYTSGTAVRVYKSNTLTISAGNCDITEISFTFYSSNYFKANNCTVNTGSLTTTGNPSKWEGTAQEVVFTNTTTDKDKWYIQTVTLTLSSSTPPSPDLTEVSSILELRGLANGTIARLTLSEDNEGNINWVSTNNGTNAYVKDNYMSVCFSNFLPDDPGWHTNKGGALIGSVVGEYNFLDGMPVFTHVSTSIADSILCLDNWQFTDPVTITDFSRLTGIGYRADSVNIEGARLTDEGDGRYQILIDEVQLPMSDHFGLNATIPDDLRGREFNIQGIVGATSDGSTSELYYTHVEEVMPELTLGETLYTNMSTIGYYDEREVNVTVDRVLTSGMWNTLCLPFDIPNFQDAVTSAKLAEFTGYNAATNTLEFTSVDNLQAGLPYLVFPNETLTSIPFYDVTINSELTPVTYGSWDMVGIFDPTTLYANDSNVLFLGEANTLYRPNVTNDLKAFRAYFRTTEGSNANICVDGITTDITVATLDTAVDGGRIYNVSGQFVGNSPTMLQKGVYVRNGSKMIIK